jgi:mono/diheme cytochrome c family protein
MHEGGIMPRTCLWALLLLSVLPGLALGQGEGATVFERCLPCHQGNGTGMAGVFPPLATHAPKLATADRSYPIKVLLYGLQGKIRIEGQKTAYDGIMPSHSSLKDDEIAAVLNYVLTSWGNDKLLPKGFKPIRAGEVKAQRGKNLTALQVYRIRQKLKLPK